MKRFSFLFLLTLLTPSLLPGQEGRFALGQVLDSIPVATQPGESFALYLPTAYAADDPAPIVFIFHPAANGSHGIEPFIKAAERYGYILVCSNNSRNGPYERNFPIAGRLFDQLLTGFAVDPNRMYTAGFSGGARLASAIADLADQIQGVIACGAGFSGHGGQLPASGESYSYVGLVGNEDFNYGEMIRNKAWLDKLGIANALFEFDMGHMWPSQEQMLLAFHWLELEAHRKGLVRLEQVQLEQIYKDYYREARMLETEEEPLRAHASYSRITRYLAAHFILDSIAGKIKKIEASPAFARQKEQRSNTLEEEGLRLEHYYRKLEKDVRRKKRYSWWEEEIAGIREGMTDPDPYKARQSRRILASLGAFAYQLGDRSDREASMLSYDICILTQPFYPYPYFRQMENYSGDPERVLDYLEKLLQSGYKDVQSLRKLRAIRELGENQRLNELLEGL